MTEQQNISAHTESDTPLQGDIQGDTHLKSQIRYMGFGWRMMAQVVDILLVSVLLYPLLPLFHYMYYTPEMREIMQSPELQQALSFGEVLRLTLPGILFQYFVLSSYILVFWLCWAATPGKRLLGMRIVDAKTGEKPTPRQLLLRFVGYILSMLPLGLGFIAIHYSRKKQGWHDMLSGTAVMEYRAKPSIGRIGGQG